jgi:hypothetical protein
VAQPEFCGVEGERNLADPAWLMPRICHHEAVVEGMMALSPVFPARFATLYTSIESLTDFMRKHEAAITRFLRQVTGHQEWALRVAVELDDLTTLDALASELWPDWLGYTPGRRYLRLCQERPGLLEVANERAAQVISAIVTGLLPLATAICPLSSPAAQQGPATQRVEKYAILAAVGRQTVLRSRLHELTSEPKYQHFRLALSGPWPPYSFRPSLDEMDPEAGGRRTAAASPIWSLASERLP